MAVIVPINALSVSLDAEIGILIAVLYFDTSVSLSKVFMEEEASPSCPSLQLMCVKPYPISENVNLSLTENVLIMKHYCAEPLVCLQAILPMQQCDGAVQT